MGIKIAGFLTWSYFQQQSLSQPCQELCPCQPWDQGLILQCKKSQTRQGDNIRGKKVGEACSSSPCSAGR